jgi:hypothetical protein
MFKLLPYSAWKAGLGAGLTFVGQSIRLDNYDGDNLSEHDDIFIVPSLIVEGGCWFIGLSIPLFMGKSGVANK